MAATIERAPRRSARAVAKRLHWHSSAHKEWGKERLYFWRLRFRPTYPRAEVRSALEDVLTEARVGSYMVYEVFGESDLLIRMWLPATIAAHEFSCLLEERLKPLDLSHEDNLEVDAILRHWVWGPGDPATPSEERMLEPPPSDDEIAAINGGEPSLPLLQRLRRERLVKDVRPHDGIKFAMIVTTPVNDLQLDQRRQAQMRLKRIVDAASRVKERSLYHGHGLGAFVILGRVAHRHFDAIRDQLADPIAMELGADWIGARTHTMIVASWEFLPFRDELPLARQLSEDEITVEEALAQPEGRRIEVKGTAFVNFMSIANGSGQLTEDTRMTHAVLRTVTAMLNGEGGTLVIGALEPDRLQEHADKLAGLPRVGEYVCAGIQHDWELWESDDDHGRGWDRFERELNSRIAERIEPLASTWIRITLEHVEDVPLARVVVKRPDRHWYYLQALDPKTKTFAKGKAKRWQFLVRRGGSTVELDGMTADEYRRLEHWR